MRVPLAGGALGPTGWPYPTVHKATVKRILGVLVPVAFFALVAWLLRDELRELDLDRILAALRSIAPLQIAAAAGFAALAYVALVSFDLLGRAYFRHSVPAATTAAIAFVCYVFTLNLGAVVGAVGFRARLYSRFGLGAGVIANITVFAVVGNWLAWLVLLGASTALYPDALARLWRVSPAAIRVGAIALALVPALYPVLCALRGGTIHIRGWAYELPGPRLACAQMAIGCAYWVWPAAVMWVLQPYDEWLRYAAVLSTSLLAAIAAVLVHVPGGLGILEATFLELVGHAAEPGDLIAMLLAFRAIFMLAPLVFAASTLAYLEWKARR